MGVINTAHAQFEHVHRHYRQEYYDLLLGVSQKGLWEDWLRFFLRGISEQSRESIFRMERLQGIRAKYQTIVEQDRNSLRMAAVTDFLFSRPILSVRQVSDELSIPFKTAQAYLMKLVQAGVLREITGYSRNRIFQADEILRVLQGIEFQ
jgi:Fic family protein